MAVSGTASVPRRIGKRSVTRPLPPALLWSALDALASWTHDEGPLGLKPRPGPPCCSRAPPAVQAFRSGQAARRWGYTSRRGTAHQMPAGRQRPRPPPPLACLPVSGIPGAPPLGVARPARPAPMRAPAVKRRPGRMGGEGPAPGDAGVPDLVRPGCRVVASFARHCLNKRGSSRKGVS